MLVSGIWFSHRGADHTGNGTTRAELTSTGRMLSAPFATTTSSPSSSTSTVLRPQPPPTPFKNRAQTTYLTTNPFSSHDNRNTIQDRGEYFGDGKDTRNLGRKLLQPLHSRLHHTDPAFLNHDSRAPHHPDYKSEFSSSFLGRPTAQPPTTRRFPRARSEPPTGPAPLPTSTTDWFGDSPSTAASKQASTRVLAISQQPYPKHNSWKYSYQGLDKIYPPYVEPMKLKHVDNVLNRYGANFVTGTHS
ncbi:uncharacterized protein LOC143293617 isoform X2 [Babylonia areolata]|uniref:uncharacterized protein LOC143293617 isoform X2 n=1 Tax=Babylonia areolata TaxID=304850 RepID=UPI003FD2AF8D